MGGITVGKGRRGGFGGGTICCSCVGRDVRGLQLLATTVSSSSSSSLLAIMWKGLLLRVTRWCMIGNWRMVRGAIMVLDVVATVRGVVTGTLGGVVGITLGGVAGITSPSEM